MAVQVFRGDNLVTLRRAFNDWARSRLTLRLYGFDLQVGDSQARLGREYRLTVSYDTAGSAMSAPYLLAIYQSSTPLNLQDTLTAVQAAAPSSFWSPTPILITSQPQIPPFFIGALVSCTDATNGKANWDVNPYDLTGSNTGPVGGDLTGTLPNPQVIQITGGTETTLVAGANDVDSVATSSTNAAHWEVLLAKGVVRRLLSVWATHDGTAATSQTTTAVSTAGTVDVTTTVVLSAGNLVLRLTPASSGWSATFRPATLFAVAAGAPVLTSISPAEGPAAGGQAFTIAGYGFTGATGVNFSGTAAASFAVATDLSITGVTPARAAGASTVNVATPSGTGSLVNGYEFVAAPTVTLVNPSGGPLAGGQAVTVTGTGFRTGATTVTFDGIPATSVVVVNATTLTCVTPADTAGLVNVAATTTGGTGTLVNGYEYLAAPVNTIAPVASGATLVSRVVSSTTGTWTGSGLSFSYQWQRNGVNIAGATSSTYTCVLADENQPITCSVTATNLGGSATATTSAIETWTPLDLPASVPIRLWFDAQQLVGVVADQGLVENATNRAPTGGNFTQSDVARRPRFTLSTANLQNRPSIANIDSGDGMTFPNNPNLLPASQAVLTQGVASLNVFSGLSNAVPGNFPTSAFPSIFWPSGTVSSTTTAWQVDAVPLSWGTNPSGLGGGGGGVLAASYIRSSGASTLGRFYDPAVPGGLLNRAPAYDRAGDMDLGELIALSVVAPAGTISLDIQQRLQGYFAWRWNRESSLPVSHPWRTTPPPFVYTPAAPTISSVSINYGATSGGTTVTVTGTNLNTVTHILFGASAATEYRSISSTSITCTTPAGVLGGVTVSAVGPGGTGSLLNGFYYRTNETIAYLNGNEDWGVTVPNAMDTFFETARSVLGTSYLVWLCCGPDLSRAIRALRSNAGVLSAVTLTNTGPFLSGDYAQTGATGGLKGNGTTQWLESALTQTNLGITTTSGWEAAYGNKESTAQPASAQVLIGTESPAGVNVAGTQIGRSGVNPGGEYFFRVAVDGAIGAATLTTGVSAFQGASRTSATNMNLLLDGAGSTATLASATPNATPFFIFARSGATRSPSPERLKFAGAGSTAMTAANLLTLRGAVIAFQTALSRTTP